LRALVHNSRDRRRRSVSHPLNEARTVPQSLAGLGFQIVHDLLHQTPEIADPFPMAYVAADAFRINDLVAPHQDLGEILWQALLAREEINDEHALADVAASLGHQFQRRVADDAGIPIMFPLDGGPGKGGGQTAAGQDMVHRDVISAAIENFKLRCLDIDGADQQAHWTSSEAAESTYFSSKLLAGWKSYRLVQFHG